MDAVPESVEGESSVAAPARLRLRRLVMGPGPGGSGVLLAGRASASADLQALFVGVVTAVMLVVLTAKDGGFSSTVWLPAALFVMVLLALVLAFTRLQLRRVEVAAIGCLVAFAAWSALSIAWAEVKGDAWDGANRTLLYLCIFCLFVVLPWRAATAAVFLSLFSLSVTTVVLVDFLRVAAAPVAHHAFFVTGRLAAPISYPNAECALLLMAAVPAIVVASGRAVPVVLRGVLLATAGAALELAVMCQSRMSLIAVPIVTLFVLAMAPRRLRLLTTAVPVAVVVALAAQRLLDVYDVLFAGPGGDALAAARTAIIASICALFVYGCALGLVDRRVHLPASAVRVAGVLVVVAALAAAAVGAAALVVAFPHPVRTLHARWTSFSHGAGYTDRRTSHLLSGGTNRYDIWRVALDEVRSAPIVGVGVDNFAADYLRLRRSHESPLYPHSVVLRIPAQTGAVGTLLFLGFLGSVAVATLRPRRRGPRAGTIVTAGLGAFLYWFVHGAADWLWETPALGAAAFACLAIAVRLGAGERPHAPAGGGFRLPVPAVAAAAVALAAALGFPWIAAQETAVAATSWPSDPGAAYRRLDLAERLNPLSEVPDEVKGLIAARSGDPARAQRAFAEAVERNPANWFAQLELGAMDSRLGRRAAASAAVRSARELDPREPAIAVVRDRLARGAPVTQELVDRLVGATPQPTGSGR